MRLSGIARLLPAHRKALRKLREAEELISAMKAAGAPYQLLKGTPYSRYALPIEYMPSRDLRPRWGHSRPRIRALDDWFRSRSEQFHQFVREMRNEAHHLRDIPLEFDEANLPEPAWHGVPYCPFDALALYTQVKTKRPNIYLEIGSGITTCFAHRAIRDGGLATKIVSIDPEPRAKVDSICDEVIRDGLETCDVGIVDMLEAGDILFMDGSHRSFMNSDVTVFFIDVLPRIRPGVIVHIHDISLPWDYDAMFTNWYWNEQYLLCVYMMGRMERIDPLLPTSFICRDKAFNVHWDPPILDLGKYNDGWRGGGAMWFTHTS